MTNRRKFFKQVLVAGLAICIPGTVGVLLSNEAGIADVIETPKIKIAQIGTGHMHAYKIGILRKLTDLFEVVAVADDDPKQRKKNENKGPYKGLPWMSTEELLAIPGLQAVAVETEEYDPLPYALRCVQAGKHVYLDKPTGKSLVDFKQILNIAESKNFAFQMGYMYRNNPAVQFCIKAVKEGLLREVFDIDATMNRYDDQSFRDIIKTFKGGTPFIIATMRTSLNEVEAFSQRYLTVRGSKGRITIRPLEIKSNMFGGMLYLALTEANRNLKREKRS